jgi:hypothetical protein
MNIYGPSAATGLGAGAGVFLLTGSPVFAMLAVFTLISAIFALKRALPRFRMHRAA